MVIVCGEAYQGWICHTRRYFPHRLTRENISCDVDEVQGQEKKKKKVAHFFLSSLYSSICRDLALPVLSCTHLFCINVYNVLYAIF